MKYAAPATAQNYIGSSSGIMDRIDLNIDLAAKGRLQFFSVSPQNILLSVTTTCFRTRQIESLKNSQNSRWDAKYVFRAEERF